MANLSKERWERIGEILNKVFDLEPGQRVAYLNEACAKDATLREEVEKYLALDEEASQEWDDDLVAQWLVPLLEELCDSDPPEPLEEQRVGPYKLLRKLGSGGMGIVYLAERADGQFERQVALKLIKKGMDTDLRQRHFLNERQILANLKHPNIAQLHDGGVTQDGQPYFVMEYIEGVPITDYCDGKRLSVDERLELFIQVCEVVQYAHQNLIVHRDLKPSNILVTNDGIVKLLDFGIAKLLEQEETATLTMPGMLMLTPDYAAPEQMLGKTVTTVTDIYALGAVLYELLTGHRPFGLTSSSAFEVQQAVLEKEPEQPSSMILKQVELAEALSSARKASVNKLRRRLRGDLDSIVLMALRKNPERRYASADALRQDIKRYMSNLPVHARPDSFVYKANKFAQRHPRGIAVTVLVILLLLSFGLRERGLRERAEIGENKAEAVKEFVVDLFEAVDPYEGGGNTVTVREILDQGARQIPLGFREQPEIQAEIRRVLGVSYRSLGLYDLAEVQLANALDVHRSIQDGIDEDVAESMYELANLRYKQGRYIEADSIHRDGLRMSRMLFGQEHETIARDLNGLALVASARGDLDKSLELNKEALNLRHKLLGDQHEDFADRAIASK